MKNALTTSPMPTGLEEILGDANGEPPDAAAILSLAHRARQAKQAGNRDDWRNTVNDLLITARGSQLKQEQKLLKMDQDHYKKMKELNESKSDLERQVKSKAYARQIVDLLKEDKVGIALGMMAVEGMDPKAMEIVGDYFYQKAALKANEGDPIAQQWLHEIKAMA